MSTAMNACPPTSPLFCIQHIADAGRGVVASTQIASGTPVLVCQRPAAHVIFRQYRREVCAQCFLYDRGRTLSVRDNEVGKVFCSVSCREEWVGDEGELGVEAWKALTRFVQQRAKAIIMEIDKPLPGHYPSSQTVNAAWDAVRQELASTTRRKPRQDPVDPDALGFFLSAILAHRRRPEAWRDQMTSLTMDDTPYKDEQDLQRHLDSIRQLASVMPVQLISVEAVQVCQDVVSAGSHNAFGIRAGGDDAEEYMGYAVYPSASFFNHSCDPNISKQRVGQAWHFTTSRCIGQGEQLCITYLGGDERDMDLDQRRQRLQEHWGFTCQCSRCSHEHNGRQR